MSAPGDANSTPLQPPSRALDQTHSSESPHSSSLLGAPNAPHHTGLSPGGTAHSIHVVPPTPQAAPPSPLIAHVEELAALDSAMLPKPVALFQPGDYTTGSVFREPDEEPKEVELPVRAGSSPTVGPDGVEKKSNPDDGDPVEQALTSSAMREFEYLSPVNSRFGSRRPSQGDLLSPAASINAGEMLPSHPNIPGSGVHTPQQIIDDVLGFASPDSMLSPMTTPRANGGFNSRRMSFRRLPMFADVDALESDTDIDSTTMRSSSPMSASVLSYYKLTTEDEAATKHGSMATLPDELLRLILDTHFAIKLHFHFRLVSKRWNYLVCSNCCLWRRYLPNYYRAIYPGTDKCNLVTRGPRAVTRRHTLQPEGYVDNDSAPRSDRANDYQSSHNNTSRNNDILSTGEGRTSEADREEGEQNLSDDQNSGGDGTASAGSPHTVLIYCFAGCAFKAWQYEMGLAHEKTRRKAQRQDMRMIMSHVATKFLVPAKYCHTSAAIVAAIGALLFCMGLPFVMLGSVTTDVWFNLGFAFVLACVGLWMPLLGWISYDLKTRHKIISALLIIGALTSIVAALIVGEGSGKLLYAASPMIVLGACASIAQIRLCIINAQSEMELVTAAQDGGLVVHRFVNSYGISSWMFNRRFIVAFMSTLSAMLIPLFTSGVALLAAEFDARPGLSLYDTNTTKAALTPSSGLVTAAPPPIPTESKPSYAALLFGLFAVICVFKLIITHNVFHKKIGCRYWPFNVVTLAHTGALMCFGMSAFLSVPEPAYVQTRPSSRRFRAENSAYDSPGTVELVHVACVTMGAMLLLLGCWVNLLASKENYYKPKILKAALICKVRGGDEAALASFPNSPRFDDDLDDG